MTKKYYKFRKGAAILEHNNQYSNGVFLSVETKGEEVVEVSKDFILPDSYADIKRVLGVYSKCSPDSVYADSGRVKYLIKTESKMLFLSDEGKIRCATFKNDLEGAMQYEKSGFENAFFMPSVISSSARAQNPRKVSIRMLVRPSVYVFSPYTADIEYKGDEIGEEERASLEILSEEISGFSALEFSSGDIESGDDISIPGALPQIEDIVLCTANITDCKSSANDGAVSVNAVVDITLLYVGKEDNALHTVRHSLPINEKYDAEDLLSDDILYTYGYVSRLSVSPSDDMSGEARVAEVDLVFSLSTLAVREKTLDITSDAYSVGSPTSCEKKTLKYLTCPIIVDEVITLSESLEKDDIERVSAAIVSPIECVCKDGEVKGTATVTLYGYDKDGRAHSSSKELSYHKTLPSSITSSLVNARVSEIKVTEGEGVYNVECNLAISGVAWEYKNTSAISAVVFEGEEDVSRDRAAFTICYPDKGEGMWEIGKRYRVPVDSLKCVNSVTREGVPRRAVIVPTGTKAIFSKIF